MLICKAKAIADSSYSLNRDFSQYKQTGLHCMIISVRSFRILCKEDKSLSFHFMIEEAESGIRRDLPVLLSPLKQTRHNVIYTETLEYPPNRLL